MEDTEIRDYVDADDGFVIDAWMRSFQETQVLVIPFLYKTSIHAFVTNFLKNPNKVIKVLCCRWEPDHIRGFIAAEKVNGSLVIHYVYVKEIYRQQKLSIKLIEKILEEKHDFVFYTHQTLSGENLRINHFRQFFYNPFLLFKDIEPFHFKDENKERLKKALEKDQQKFKEGGKPNSPYALNVLKQRKKYYHEKQSKRKARKVYANQN